MTAGEGAAAAAPAQEEAPAPAGQQGTAPDAPGRDVEDAPSAKKMMAEKGLTRDEVQGTGRDGRVMKEDVLKALSQPKPAEAPEAGRPARPRPPRTPSARSGSR